MNNTFEVFQRLPSSYSLAALLWLAPLAGYAEDYRYITNIDGTITITEYIGRGGTAMVPSNINGLPVTSIGERAFYAWFYTYPGLTNVIIPETVTNIGFWALLDGGVAHETGVPDHTSLAAITVHPDNPAYCSVDGVLFDKVCSALIQFPSARAEPYTVPATVTRIGTNAFYGSYQLPNVTLPPGLKVIGEFAFGFCTKLSAITIPESVDALEAFAFYNCDSLASIRIPDSITTIPDGAFNRCASLTNVTIGKRTRAIGGCAFGGCLGLTRVLVPKSVKTFGTHLFVDPGGPFGYCSNLTSVYFEGDAPVPDQYAFYGADRAVAYYLPGTIGWNPTFGDRPTQHWYRPAPTILDFGPAFGVQTNRYGFIVSWATNAAVTIDASTTLGLPDWIPIATNVLSSGMTYFNDPDWMNHSARFYRARSQ